MAMDYGFGYYGLPVDEAKCIDLLRQSADLGLSQAHYHLGSSYATGTTGLKQNEEEAFKYFEKAAESGHLDSRNNLGCKEARNGNDVAAMRHWRLAASGGFKLSMEVLFAGFEQRSLRHSDLAKTLRAFYRARAEMTSEDRKNFIEYLKRNGKYKEEYDL